MYDTLAEPCHAASYTTSTEPLRPSWKNFISFTAGEKLAGTGLSLAEIVPCFTSYYTLETTLLLYS